MAKELSVKAKRRLIAGCQAAFREGILNDDALWTYIAKVLGYEIPRVAFCPEHDAPFKFVSDVFFGRCAGGAAVGFANRGGGKTLDLAVLENAGMVLRAPLDIYHFGSVATQSDICYGYFTKFAEMEHMAHLFPQREIQRIKTETTNGSSISIRPATMQKVSGPHPPWAFLDEVETLKRRGVLEKFRGMSQRSGDNHGIDVYTSTRDRTYGPFQRVLEWARKHRIAIYKWCIWDVLETCHGRNCKKCRAWARCQGKARRTQGFYPIEDFIRRAASLDDETWEAQFLCQRPQRTGAVYKEFDPAIHVSKTPLTYNKAWPIWLVGDPGWRAADKEGKRGKFVVCDFQRDPYDRVYVIRENRFIFKTPLQAGQEMREQTQYNWQGIIWDTEDPGGVRDFLTGLGRSLPIIRFDKGQVVEGIRKVQPFIKIRGDGLPGLIFDPSCEDAIFEMLAYHYKDYADNRPVEEKPEKVDDHFPDNLRMFIVAIMERGQARAPIVGPVRDVEEILKGY